MLASEDIKNLSFDVLMEIDERLNNNDDIEMLNEKYGYNRDVLYIFNYYSEFYNPTISDLIDMYYLNNTKRINDCEYNNTIETRLGDLERTRNEIKIHMKSIITRTLSCLSCNVNSVNILFLPCGHVISCENCFTDDFCFSCKTRIVEKIRIYL